MQETEKVYWSSLVHHGWIVYAAATTTGLCYVTFPNHPFAEVAQFVERHFRTATLEHSGDLLAPCLVELTEYLDGKRSKFTVPLDLRGTPFQVSVWKTLLTIPHGETATYSDIAQSIGNPLAVRAVGAAIGANPVAFIVPCHRVVGKDGALTGYRGGLDVKSKLLQMEGMTCRSAPLGC